MSVLRWSPLLFNLDKYVYKEMIPYTVFSNIIYPIQYTQSMNQPGDRKQACLLVASSNCSHVRGSTVHLSHRVLTIIGHRGLATIGHLGGGGGAGGDREETLVAFSSGIHGETVAIGRPCEVIIVVIADEAYFHIASLILMACFHFFVIPQETS